MISRSSYPDKLLSIKFKIKNAQILLVLRQIFFTKSFVFKPLYHNHSKHEFFFVTRGECGIKIDGEEYLLRAKSFIGVPAGLNHHFCHKSEDAQIFPVNFQFFETRKQSDKADIDFFRLLNELFSHKNNPHIFNECSKVFESFERLSEVFQNIEKPLYEEYFESAVMQFFIDVIYCMDVNSLISNNNEKSSAISSDIKYAVFSKDDELDEQGKQFYTEIIEGYLSDLTHRKITLSELADRLQLSVRHTGRLVKQIYNVGFNELFNRIRMNIAKSMIHESELSFESISEKTGYSYKGFLYIFKRITGKTPTEFKKISYIK